jgi:glutamyl-tRNA synthetase
MLSSELGEMHPEPAPSGSGYYRGRLAPSPTGYLHLGHARTFWTAQQRAREAKGKLILRNEDLDRERCKPEFVEAMFEDLRWFGFEWQEGPDIGGPFGPYSQSERVTHYVQALEKLHATISIYPCTCSRQDVLRALQAPHEGEDEPIYPGTCREKKWPRLTSDQFSSAVQSANSELLDLPRGTRVNWRFRVEPGEAVQFTDGQCGPQEFVAGKDFGDFVVWRHDHIPAYQLAVVVDDAAMAITEVVRGEDLLASTARQLLIYGALGLTVPNFYHCPLVADEKGQRLAKRHDAVSLRTLRKRGCTPEEIKATWQANAR